MWLHVIRLFVALLTFAIGLGASALWNSPRPARPKAHSTTPRTAEPGFVGVRPTTNLLAASEQSVNGGVLNGKAISKVAPVYPPIAKAARASGTVGVEIVVGEAGDVVAARAVSGHPLLQRSAVEAVRQWKFTPTLLSGRPVMVYGSVSVNFRLD